jgi:hypothetical protein
MFVILPTFQVELGRIDIATKISLLSSHPAYPRVGHLDVALHVMGYLKQKHNTCLVFDPTYPTIDMDSFPQYDWTEFYGNIKKAIPFNMPMPLDKDLDVCVMSNSEHAGEKRTPLLTHWFLNLLQYGFDQLGFQETSHN